MADESLRPSAESVLGVGRVVRERRRRLGLSQQDLADLADVGVRLVHEVERGSSGVRLVNLLRLVAALGLALEVRGPGVEPVALTVSSRGDGPGPP